MTNPRNARAADGGIGHEAWQRRRGALARNPGVAALARELSDGRTLSLAYARGGPRTSAPALVIPGGPGLASVMPYQRFRAAAARRGLDVLMVEHRGVGMSRKTEDGSDLRSEDVTIRDVLSDLAAVLDSEGIEQVTVYGSSYGSYLAGAFGALHPDRVSGMILDSPMLDARSKHETARELNRLYWHGTETTAEHASRIHRLVECGSIRVEQAGFPIQLLHESGGPGLVASMLNLLEKGKGARVWSWLNRLGASDVMASRPFLMEFDLVARSAFAELGYGVPHDPALGPLRGDELFVGMADRFPPFESESVDIRCALARFDWPVLVLSGDRDVRTPRTVADQVMANAPDAILVLIERHGHSALDTAQRLAINAIRHLANMQNTSTRPDPAELRAPRSMIARLISLRLALARLLPKAAS
ncbi:MAG: alpha/beta hydrolase [Bifidobacteriaceae bacterium]|jgi:pimeloyl-ACP methyl ester carboxylesterase|nr:alpha/beta hydrolase [Bifidobacteriaceae bacterium]